jgi:8-oxo-dGTP pyrophosphatase MutT (NUDIX family)
MIRTHLISLLESYNPTPTEIAYKERMLAFIKKHPDCFERSLEIGHITASAWLLNDAQDKVLLLHHAKLDLWVQPGGHCDGDSDVAAVALKEAQEESGINDIVLLSPAIFDIDIHAIPEHKGVPAHDHYDVRFLMKARGSDAFVQNHESKAIQWFAKDEPLPTDHLSVVRMHTKWKLV